MSYNVSGFRVKALKDFLVPLDLVTATMNVQLYPAGRVEVTGDSEMFKLLGRIEGDWIKVIELHEGGEHSGYHFSDVLEPLFAKSKGLLVALVVWEGGDTIEICTWEDGVLTRENIGEEIGHEETDD